MEQRQAEDQDRIRSSSDPEINRQIDVETMLSIDEALEGGEGAIAKRLEELDREWDVERYLMTNAAAFGFTGVVLSATVSRKWLLLPGVVTAFLFQHALQGWCPPLWIFRRMGVRSRKEIDREKFALKALRGDFEGMHESRQAMLAATE
jgi:hypothetical protein